MNKRIRWQFVRCLNCFSLRHRLRWTHNRFQIVLLKFRLVKCYHSHQTSLDEYKPVEFDIHGLLPTILQHPQQKKNIIETNVPIVRVTANIFLSSRDYFLPNIQNRSLGVEQSLV